MPKNSKKLTKQQDENLIKFVKENPILWNVAHKGFNNRKLKELVWIQIANKMKKDGKYKNDFKKPYSHFIHLINTNFSVDVLKQRWRNIKDYSKKQRKRELPTGSEMNEDEMELEEDANEMFEDDSLSFLDKCPTERETLSSVEVDPNAQAPENESEVWVDSLPSDSIQFMASGDDDTAGTFDVVIGMYSPK